MNFIIADDHPFTLAGTKIYIEQLGYQVIDTANNGQDALAKVISQKPDFLLLDINMPLLNGLNVCEKINDLKLSVNIILITSHNEMSILRKSQSLGVKGYILKEHAEDELKNCIEFIMAGKNYFSPNLLDKIEIDKAYIKNEALLKLNFIETKIVELIAQNKTSKQIAELLFISEKTIEGHRSKIIEKLDLPQEKNVLMKWALDMLD